MKAYRCLTNNSGYHLTIGKIYLVEKYVQSKLINLPVKVRTTYADTLGVTNKVKHLIINDKGFEHFIFDDELENFIDIEQEREDKLKQLGI
jgi:hypothetical protein